MTPPTSPTLSKVLAGELCSGCGLCAGISHGAITLETVAPGYTRPRQLAAIDSTTEAVIRDACPGSRVSPWEDGAQTHPYWGPYRQVATGHATDPEVRFTGSSGGVASALLIAALDTGLVDRALHVVADPERPTRNILHWSATRAEVLAGAGSRYAASSPLADIDAALSAGHRFAFVGKPCDVSALRQLARHDPRVDRQIPIMLSFFCGGIPSHAGSDRIIRAMGMEPAEVVRFRYRGQGWPGTARAETGDGGSAEMSYADSWGGHLSKEVQFRCKICPDAIGGAADIAVADAWYGGESGYPTFEEQDGRSLVMTRTARGEQLLQQAIGSAAIEVTPLPIGDIILMQPSQARRKRMVLARLSACAATLQPRPDVRGLKVLSAARQASIRESLHNLLGTTRRILIGRR